MIKAGGRNGPQMNGSNPFLGEKLEMSLFLSVVLSLPEASYAEGNSRLLSRSLNKKAACKLYYVG